MRIWLYNGKTVNDETGDIAYEGKIIEKAEHRSNIIWEKVKKMEGFQFAVLAGRSSFRVAGTELSYTIGKGNPIAIKDSTSKQVVQFSASEQSIITVKGNITDIGFFYSSNLYAILTPFPATMSAITNLDDEFSRCGNLTAVPSDLLVNLPNVQRLGYLFYKCYNLKEIPEHLFDVCPAVNDFGGTFWGCESLTSIPQGLFDKCTKVTSFFMTFAYCYNLEGVAPALWLRTSPTPDGNSCFKDCSKLSNFNAIPYYWKYGD